MATGSASRPDPYDCVVSIPTVVPTADAGGSDTTAFIIRSTSGWISRYNSDASISGVELNFRSSGKCLLRSCSSMLGGPVKLAVVISLFDWRDREEVGGYAFGVALEQRADPVLSF